MKNAAVGTVPTFASFVMTLSDNSVTNLSDTDE